MIANYKIKIIYLNLDFNSSIMYFTKQRFFLQKIRKNDSLIYKNSTTCTCLFGKVKLLYCSHRLKMTFFFPITKTKKTLD